MNGTNLMVEYANRRGSRAVMGANDGVCFFSVGGDPSLVVLTGANPRQYGRCDACHEGAGDLLVEVLVPDPAGEFGLRAAHHHHLAPDANIRAHVAGLVPGAEPVYAQDHQALEVWLWRLYSEAARLRTDVRWRRFVGGQQAKKPTRKALEQMAWVAARMPAEFRRFYSFCGLALAGRHYLLMRTAA